MKETTLSKEKKDLIAGMKRQIKDIQNEKKMYQRRIHECTFNVAALKRRIAELSK